MPVKNLLEGYKSFKAEFEKNKSQYLELAEKGQFPKILWIGCSDSRVIPEKILNVGPGELFVIRNIANIIPPVHSNDVCTSSVLEFAVNNFGIRNTIICGHTECAGINFLLSKESETQKSSLASWVNNALPVKERLANRIVNQENIFIEAVKENLFLQKENLFSFDFIKSRISSGELKIHIWYYDLHNGEIFVYDEEDGTWDELSISSANKIQ